MERAPKTREHILSAIEAHKETIRRFSVRRLGLFGSVARGEATDCSDLDFLVEFETASFDNYFDLKHFLEDLFECPVDLVMQDVIKPRIRPNILKDAVYGEGL